MKSFLVALAGAVTVVAIILVAGLLGTALLGTVLSGCCVANATASLLIVTSRV